MSTILCRDGEAKDYWFSGQWGLYLTTMELFGWIPRGTEYYMLPDALRFQHSVLKDAVYSADMDDLFDFTCPEELAEHAEGWEGRTYEEMLQFYETRWGRVEPLEIPARPDPSWCGSYVGNSGQVVTSEDATGMSFALGRATDEIDRNGEILMPDGDNGGSRPVAGSTYRLQEKDEDNKNPCILEGGAAVRALAAWLAKGEFRIF